MKLGFIVMAHENLDRVAQLVRHLAEQNCVVAVHIDKDVSKDRYVDLEHRLREQRGVVFSKRHSCEWGRFSIVQATLDAAEFLLDSFNDVTNICLISGSCLPLRPIRQMQTFLGRNRGTDYIESVSVANNYWVKDGLNEERFTLYFPFSWRKNRKMFDWFVEVQRKLGVKRKIPDMLEPHIGSQWWCLTRKTLRSILNDPRRQYYDNYFRSAWIPDEAYFQTLARLHSKKISSRSLTFSKFDFQGKPYNFYDDLLENLPLSDCFMVRKIWRGADKLYEVLLDRNRPSQPMTKSDPKKFEELFETADSVRCVGGEGRFHQGRFPYDRADRTGVSAEKFTVFVGFSSVFKDYDDWLNKSNQSVCYGRVFSRKSVGSLNKKDHFAGNLPAETWIRNRNPKGYLANLLWMGKGKNQSILYDFRDNSSILETLAFDTQAHVIIIRHSWLLTLLNRTTSFQNTLENAQRFIGLEQRFFDEFNKKDACARLKVIELEDVITRTDLSYLNMASTVNNQPVRKLLGTPERNNSEGLESLVKRLRNKGLPVDYKPVRTEDVVQVEPAPQKRLYVVK